jgi:outer membrane protein OmpA-like peptidoglycan-associated protein
VGANGSQANVGWTAGGGVDYALGALTGINNLVIGLEYRYTELGNVTLHGNVGGSANIQNLRSNTGLVNITYHFNMTPPPPPPVAAPPAAPAAVAPAPREFIVFFEFDKSSLTPDGRQVVDAAAAAFKAGATNVSVSGHTDTVGTEAYNMALSRRRADTVAAALIRDGVPASAIEKSYHGFSELRVPTAKGVREAQNRRVEIKM